MNKEYVPYEQALELKQLGYPQDHYINWYSRLDRLEHDFEYVQEDYTDACCAAPLYQQAFRWFREKHNLDLSINTV